MTYRGIDRCDRCGKPLEHGQWLSGLCKRCEKAGESHLKTQQAAPRVRRKGRDNRYV